MSERTLMGLILAMLLTVTTGWAETPTTSTQASAAKPAAKRPEMSKTVAQAVAIGKDAPGFKAMTFEGEMIDLKSQRGKVVLVAFWASWCGFCVKDAPALKALHEEFGKNPKFVMIGLSLDNNMDRAEKFVTDRKMNWIQGFLGDWTTDKVSAAYNCKEIPMMFLIGPDGKIIDKDDHAQWLREPLAKALAQVK